MVGTAASGRKPYDEPTDRVCPHCNQGGFTRQRLSYHLKEQCTAFTGSKRYIAPKPKDEPIKAPEPAMVPPKAPEPEPVARDLVVGATDDYPQDGSIEHDEPLASFDGDNQEIPVVFIFVAVFCLMLISGLVIFREKIIEFFKRRGKPPAYGVPNYAG